jgi:hypothetical protein
VNIFDPTASFLWFPSPIIRWPRGASLHSGAGSWLHFGWQEGARWVGAQVQPGGVSWWIKWIKCGSRSNRSNGKYGNIQSTYININIISHINYYINIMDQLYPINIINQHQSPTDITARPCEQRSVGASVMWQVKPGMAVGGCIFFGYGTPRDYGLWWGCFPPIVRMFNIFKITGSIPSWQFGKLRLR